ncbi:MAG TPA: ribonuclease P protein component [Patescibacteria group bacterium]|nr:ribonuclease P protein component [Patescibacteria group bacterium]
MLAKKYRIKKQKEFNEFFGKSFKQNKGKNFSDDVLIFKFFPTKEKNSRFAFVVSNKVDNRAVKRNRMKRLVRSVVEDNLKKIISGYDCLFIAKPAIAKKQPEQIKKSTEILLKKAGLL